MEMRNFSYKKSLGQNFIFDENFLKSVINEIGITPKDTVVEIGAGAGTLTRVLAKTANRVIAYELDNRLEPILQKNLCDCENVELHFQDALKVKTFPENFKLVANIPYYITTPLLLKFVRMPECTEICVLVQEELAQRIVAPHGTKEYGALSITMQTLGKCNIMKRVPRKMFTPSPNVDSAFVQIRKNPFICHSKVSHQATSTKAPFKEGGGTACGDGGCLDSYNTFDHLVKGIFSARRKTMLNALKQTLKIDTPLAQRLLEKADIDETLRPEQIPPNKFAKLSQIIAETSI